MQDYSSLCAVVMICATLVTIQTHTHILSHAYRCPHTHSDQLVWKAQPAALKIEISKLISVTYYTRLTIIAMFINKPSIRTVISSSHTSFGSVSFVPLWGHPTIVFAVVLDFCYLASVAALKIIKQDCSSDEDIPSPRRIRRNAFCSCDLDLDLTIYMYEFGLDILKMYGLHSKNEVSGSRFQKLEPKQTETQMHKTESITCHICRW